MIKKRKYSIYQKYYNITFIMVDAFENGKRVSSECVGLYYGTPTQERNEYYTNKLKATYELED